MTYVDGPGDGFAHQDCHDGYVVGEIVFTTNSSSSAPLQILTVSGTPDALSDSTSESQLMDSRQPRFMKNPIRRLLYELLIEPFAELWRNLIERNTPTSPTMMKTSNCNPSNLFVPKRRAASGWYLA
jgi:hypothetical protein